MTTQRVSVLYVHEEDLLDVLREFRGRSVSSATDERILTRIDDQEEVVGFPIQGMSALRESSPALLELEFEPLPMTRQKQR